MQNKVYKLFILVVVLLVIAAALPFLPSSTSHAQGSNLLLNNNFDQSFTPRGGVEGFVPASWEFRSSGDVVYSDRDTFGAYVRSAPQSWVFKQEYHAVTSAVGYQIVTVEASKTYTASAYSFIWACNDTAAACRTSNSVTSDASSGAAVKIGIDPAGGSDPNAATVVWSAPASPHTQVVWQQLTVSTTATGTSMTVFLHFSSTTGMRWTEAHWDDAALVSSDGSVPGGTTTAATAVPPTPAFVPFVVPQQPRADGSLVHIVQSQDTIDSIMVAYRDLYGVLGYTKEDLYEFNSWRFPPEYIVIGQEIIILPAGYVDPATGQLLVEPDQPPPTQAATAEATPAATTSAPDATAEPGAPATTAPTEAAAVPATETAPSAGSETTPAQAPVSEAVQPIDPFLPEGSIMP